MLQRMANLNEMLAKYLVADQITYLQQMPTGHLSAGIDY